MFCSSCDKLMTHISVVLTAFLLFYLICLPPNLTQVKATPEDEALKVTKVREFNGWLVLIEATIRMYKHWIGTGRSVNKYVDVIATPLVLQDVTSAHFWTHFVYDKTYKTPRVMHRMHVFESSGVAGPLIERIVKATVKPPTPGYLGVAGT
ncbi:hypothetical protein CVS40_7644 [Lucilia cuprina]|nr:hypothetical protein CVS40_7644 [Lucilia cuprina]